LAGVPPFGGFWSKELVLTGAFTVPALAGLGLLTALGSSLYIGRMLLLTFLGDRPWQRGPRAHAHEVPLSMAVPVLILAAGGASAGFLAEPLARLLGAEHHHAPRLVTGLSCAMMLAGAALAWLSADGDPAWEPTWRSAHPAFAEAVESDFGWQPFCSALARGVARGAGLLAELFEAVLWDAGTEDLAAAAPALGERLARLSRGLLNDYAWWMTAGAAAMALTVALCR
jgi:NADH-quinone oxidoreductase subunit L